MEAKSDSEKEFRPKFDAQTRQLIEKSGLTDFLLELSYNVDPVTFAETVEKISEELQPLVNAEWYRAESAEAFKAMQQLKNKYGSFMKTARQNIENGTKGGQEKGEKMYQDFLSLVKRKKVNVQEYPSNEKLAIALMDFGKDENYKIAPKTAGKYKSRYLNSMKSGK